MEQHVDRYLHQEHFTKMLCLALGSRARVSGGALFDDQLLAHLRAQLAHEWHRRGVAADMDLVGSQALQRATPCPATLLVADHLPRRQTAFGSGADKVESAQAWHMQGRCLAACHAERGWDVDRRTDRQVDAQMKKSPAACCLQRPSSPEHKALHETRQFLGCLNLADDNIVPQLPSKALKP
jgi:hypothetical protein